ncbi:zinc finger, RING/FYVE/PHD-type, acyl-CoA N-acyltransferase, Jas TPL-binding domain protein [Tanacetum coccineum]
MTGHTAYPVFYDVGTHQVRKNKVVAFGEAFARHRNYEAGWEMERGFERSSRSTGMGSQHFSGVHFLLLSICSHALKDKAITLTKMMEKIQRAMYSPEYNPQNYYSSCGSMLKTNPHVKNKAKKRNLDQMDEVFSCNRPMKQIQDLQKLILWRGGVLKSLIENNIVERGSTVSYLTRKGGRVMKKGRVYEDGIKCDCCDDMFLLTKFELHAGSTNHRAAANLFFYDKRSILDCETQLHLESVLPADDDKSTKSVVTSTKSSDYVTDTNDDYCSFCNDEGELLLCDSCTSSFISTLLDWIIYLGLTEIRGKVIPLKGNNLNWSLLKYDENDTDVYELTKSYNIIEDVIFSGATKRSNFEGFYTAVLEKNNEIITVVTLRIHGYKVAEIPFVATTFSYRRLGMCRILMDVVERMIRGLGVERIVLPASTDKLAVVREVTGSGMLNLLSDRQLQPVQS